MLLVLLYVLLLGLSPLLVERLPPAPSTDRPRARVLSLPAPPQAQTDHFAMHRVVQPNETLEGIFRSLGLDPGVLFDLLANRRIREQLEDLRPGDTLAVEPDSEGAVARLLIDRNSVWQLRVERRDGEYRAVEVHRRPQDGGACGEIRRSNDSMQADAEAAGVPEDIVQQIDELLSWSVDLALESRAGDLFLVLYKELFVDGRRIGYGPVTALEYRSADGRELRRVFRYQLPGAEEAAYYAQDGSSIEKAFLRAPLRSNLHVSSPYNPQRMHPQLHVIKAHTGVDYLARVGAEIQATGDGKVVIAGTRPGYGNLIAIEHEGGYQTRYGHLNSFAKGITAGTWVRQGQLIGRVGMTGQATGPHLHYEFRIDGEHRDPETINLPSAPPIPEAEKALFTVLNRTRTAQLHLCSRFLTAEQRFPPPPAEPGAGSAHRPGRTP